MMNRQEFDQYVLDNIKDQEYAVPEINIMDYEATKEKLYIRLCDYEKNPERLEGLVYKIQGDFAVTYHINLLENQGTDANPAVTPALLEHWNVTPEQLHEDALVSDKARKAALYELSDLIEAEIFGVRPDNILKGETEPRLDQYPPMYCLTNESINVGASMILQEDIMKQIGEILGDDFYVLPSSIHETLILPVYPEFTVQELNDMVHDINTKQVDEAEQLSDKVQFYDRSTGVLENAQKHQERLEKAKEKQMETKQGIRQRISVNKNKAPRVKEESQIKSKGSELEI